MTDDRITASGVPNLTTADVAKQFSVSPSTAWRWMVEGKLQAFKLGAVYRTTQEWIDEFVRRNTMDPTEIAAEETLDSWFPRGVRLGVDSIPEP